MHKTVKVLNSIQHGKYLVANVLKYEGDQKVRGK